MNLSDFIKQCPVGTKQTDESHLSLGDRTWTLPESWDDQYLWGYLIFAIWHYISDQEILRDRQYAEKEYLRKVEDLREARAQQLQEAGQKWEDRKREIRKRASYLWTEDDARDSV
jgi:hypothetical protein